MFSHFLINFLFFKMLAFFPKKKTKQTNKKPKMWPNVIFKEFFGQKTKQNKTQKQKQK